MLFCQKLILGVWLTAVLTTEQKISQPTVTTKSGKLKGKLMKVKGTDRHVNAYFGIPFAKPPIGQLRFSPPQPAEPWNGVRDATSYPPWCVQNVKAFTELPYILKNENYPHTVSEDCLYLTVYAPADTSKNARARLPVMVWIHGGGLLVGDASTYDGSALVAYENVVVVTIQYRLGFLGFFSTGDEHARGNWAFMDQVAALKWVQENIESFGGDPDSVTIFGNSAGATSVSILVLSPLAKGLFHKAIIESGSALIPDVAVSDPGIIATFVKEAADVSGCKMSSAALVECLRMKTEEEMLNISTSLKTVRFHFVMDGVVLRKSPKELLANKEVNPVPCIFGVNTDEFGWLLSSAMSFPGLLEGMNREQMDRSLQNIVWIMDSTIKFIDLILDEYVGDTENPVQLRDQFLEMMGDLVIAIPVIKTAKYHRDAGFPVYVFELQHRPSAWASPRPDYLKGADHTDEIGFVFGGPFLDSDVSVLGNATDEEKTLSRTMMKYWANFARQGNPNSNGLVKWPVYDQKEQYLELNLKQKIGTKLRDHRVMFWMETLPEKVKAREHAEL
ncbi:fatty acyl-CoA hydrolase precursor, medium chain [Microcaecilia unicolor]|uniref:Carboxylic ester hydrolase n=1 Tax=Microcaecilia unicolor TaxID=1415580 RepID=A0A6P7Y5S8_9AMPH|nr:fatty acyl-CoA hydrolase precursor, medium chain-like [Microcaecilia unicolor]